MTAGLDRAEAGGGGCGVVDMGLDVTERSGRVREGAATGGGGIEDGDEDGRGRDGRRINMLR